MFSFFSDKSKKKEDYNKKLLDQANTAYGTLDKIKIPDFSKDFNAVDVESLYAEVKELLVIAYNQDNGFDDLQDRFKDVELAVNKHLKVTAALEQQWEQAFHDKDDFEELLETNLVYFSTQYELFEKLLSKWFINKKVPTHAELIEKIKKINKKASLNAHSIRTYNKELNGIFSKNFENQQAKLLYLCLKYERLSYRSDLCIDALQILSLLQDKMANLIKYSPNLDTFIKYYRKGVMSSSKEILLLAHGTLRENGKEVYEQIFN